MGMSCSAVVRGPRSDTAVRHEERCPRRRWITHPRRVMHSKGRSGTQKNARLACIISARVCCDPFRTGDLSFVPDRCTSRRFVSWRGGGWGCRLKASVSCLSLFVSQRLTQSPRRGIFQRCKQTGRPPERIRWLVKKPQPLFALVLINDQPPLPLRNEALA